MTSYTPFTCYQIYNAIKLHFTSNFDFFKYGYRLKTLTPEKFKADEYTWQKLYNKFPNEYDLRDFIAICFYHHKLKWVGEIKQYINEYSDEILAAERVKRSTEYVVQEELKRILEVNPDLSKLFSEVHIFARECRQHTVSPEAFIVINKACQTYDSISKNYMNMVDKMWFERINIYEPFVSKWNKNPNEIRRVCIKVIKDYQSESSSN